jgi:peptidoglycan/LPS O-acetylase OafA/YrhL
MQRNATIDYARLLAAFGIVLFHADGPGAEIGYAALPFFLMLMVITVVPGARQADFAAYARARATRLLRPWLLWTAIYGSLKLGEVIVLSSPLQSEFRPWMLLTGPALHLWFLPFAVFVCLALHPMVRWADTAIRARLLTALLVVAALLALALWARYPALPVPAPQWLHAAPSVFLGLAIALCADRPLWQIGLSVIVCAVALGVGWTANILQLALAAFGLILCLNWRLPVTALSRWTAAMSLGVYLAHPLVLSVLQRTTEGHLDTASRSIVACLGALAVAAAMDLTTNRWRRWRNTFSSQTSARRPFF